MATDPTLDPNADSQAIQAANERRQADILNSLQKGTVPSATRERLKGARSGTLPWTATLSPAELLIVRSHGLRPIASVSATCWLHHGWSWTEGHAQGWETALRRLREEAKAAGANAVLDVKMRTIPLHREQHRFHADRHGRPRRRPAAEPGADRRDRNRPWNSSSWSMPMSCRPGSPSARSMTGSTIGAIRPVGPGWAIPNRLRSAGFWETIRQRAHAELRRSASGQGNGVLAHINFSQMFEFEGGEKKPKRYLGRHIVVATTVDARAAIPFEHEITMVVDVHAGATR
ncbi:MAG: hypothetical protein WDN69_01425 [Aliidongia sp.]